MEGERKGLGLGLLLALFMLGFGATLAYLIGSRISSDAAMIIIGLGMGLAIIALPSFLVVWAVLRRDVRAAAAAYRLPAESAAYDVPPQPQVVVLQQPPAPAAPPTFERTLGPTAAVAQARSQPGPGARAAGSSGSSGSNGSNGSNGTIREL